MKYESTKELNNLLLMVIASDDWLLSGRIKRVRQFFKDNVFCPIEEFKEHHEIYFEFMGIVRETDIALYNKIDKIIANK